MAINTRKGFVSEINVTPFVDVMLVLLIIFMVTAPMMTEGLEVTLPQSQVVASLPTDDNHVVLTLKADGSIYLNEHLTQADTLALQLQETVKKQDKKLFLRADKDVPYGLVVDIMGRIKAADIDELNIVAERIDSLPANPNLLPTDDQPASRRR